MICRKVVGLTSNKVTGFFSLPNPSCRTIDLGYTQSLTEMSTRSRKAMFAKSRVLPEIMADNLTAICESII
jgi:hypothetical protein